MYKFREFDSLTLHFHAVTRGKNIPCREVRCAVVVCLVDGVVR